MALWDRAASELTKMGYTHFIVTPGASFTYLTGWETHLSERLTLFGMRSDGKAALLVPKLEASGVSSHQNIKIFNYSDETGPTQALQAFVSELDLTAESRVGIESMQLRVFEANFLLQQGVKHLLAADELPMSLRLIKDDQEIAHLQSAAEIVDAALTAALPLFRFGMTELDVAAELEYQMRKLGSQGTPFATIVGSGPRGALPHGGPTTKRITAGELVVLDYGARFAGYAADTTRTLAFGEPSDTARRVYEIVRTAQQAAIDGVTAGMTAAQVDRLAREVIERAGYGEYFTHRTGHGLGLDVHEYPSIMEGNELALTAGMVFTIEPGIYLPGEFGVRIEDDVVVTAKGALVLTRFTKELMVVGN
ncbi:M24 family metallopeptidase [Sulfoacidibacillus thermotolerans]|uniref:Peptidase M24 family protein n=1 Tax=Sulfoacidibacillus thermotolerans TaxID=1765684 RepID=A0A2U3D8L0_SULT2|nr:Xaa-Pro peptidase family protein [Sulfoacidibacillus thermotolerans]PWI57616.1 hypothetical protein BM613_07410 [Sulfoacidibacillus thermotolerans]